MNVQDPQPETGEVRDRTPQVGYASSLAWALAVLSCPLLWPAVWLITKRALRMLGDAAWNPHAPPHLPFATLVMLLALAAIVSGHLAIAGRRRVPGSKRLQWHLVLATALGYVNLLAVLALLSVGYVGKWRPNADMAACYHNLARLESALRDYAAKNHGAFPPLSPKSGVLMFTPEALHTNDDLSAFLTCPIVRNAPGKGGPAVPFDDQSYFYLGYALRNEDAVEAFAKAYLRRIAEGGTFDEDLVLTDHKGTHTIHRLRQGVKELLSADHDPLSASPYEGRQPEYQVPTVTCDDVPLLIERDLGHKDPDWDGSPRGAHVLFLNAGVQYVARGTWPITEKTQRLLGELAK